MSSFSGDYRQNVILALQTQGADALTTVRDAIQEVNNKLAVLNQQYDGTRPAEYVRALNSLGAELKKLGQLELELSGQGVEASRARIEAIRSEDRARAEATQREIQAAGDALRARIDAHAREERAAEQAAAARVQAAGDALRAQVDAIAREESSVRQLVAAEIRAAGEAKLARIEYYAAVDARAEASYRAKNEAVRQQIADEAALQAALGKAEQRKHDLAAEEAYEQQLRDQAALQEHLGRLEREAGEAAEQAQVKAAAARRTGTAAIEQQIKAIEEARVASDRAASNAQKNAGAKTWVNKQDADLNELLRDLAAYEARADALTATELRNYQTVATASAKAGGVVKKSQEESQRAARGTTQAILEISRGFEDFTTGGFVGVLNNIPGTIQGIGQAANLTGVEVAALTGGVSLFAATVFLAYQNWDKIEKAFGSTVIETTLNRVNLLKESLKELEDKKVKTAIDYSDIDIAKRKLDQLSEAQSAYDRLVSGKTKTQQEIGKRASEAITEFGGGDDYESSAERVVRGLQGAIPYEESTRTGKLRERLAQQEEALRDAPERNKEIFQHYRDVAHKELLDSLNLDRAAQAKAFQEQVGLAASGKDSALGFIQEAAERAPEAFARQGVGPGFLPGLIRARRGRVEEDKAQENLVKIRKDDQQQTEKVARENVERAKVEAQEAQAKAEADATKTRLKVQAEFIKVMDDNAKAIAREANRSGNAAKRQADQLDRQAPTRERRQAEAAYGQEFQSRARKLGIPIGGAQAETAGKDVARLVRGGADVDSAMEQALANLASLLGRQNQANLRNAAAWERMNGIVGQASMQLMAVEQQHRRAAQRRRTLGQF
jgi:hypothetical protein